MSLLSSIQVKKKQLKNCSTTVTQLSGNKYIENRKVPGVRSLEFDKQHPGYIIDLKPDLQVVRILPFLTFGSQDVTANLQVLTTNRISDVISLGVKPIHTYNGIVYKFINCLDVPEENLVDILVLTNNLIDRIRGEGNRTVFVHCNAGCSRAPCVVIGYLMHSYGYSYDQAYLLLKEKRYIRPNEGFVRQLIQYSQK